MARLDAVERVDGFVCPVDPQEAVECDACQ